MSLIKKCDVKNYLSTRHRKEVHPDEPESQPAATGFSKAEPAAPKANPSDFAKDFQVEHSFSGKALAPGAPLTGSIGRHAL